MEFCRTLSFLEVEFNNLILTDHECLKDFLFLMSCHFIVIQFNFYGENMNNNPFFIWQPNYYFSRWSPVVFGGKKLIRG